MEELFSYMSLEMCDQFNTRCPRCASACKEFRRIVDFLGTAGARGARAGAGGFGARGPEAERRGQLASGSPHGRPPHVQAPALTGGSPAPARAACGTGSNSRGGR